MIPRIGKTGRNDASIIIKLTLVVFDLHTLPKFGAVGSSAKKLIQAFDLNQLARVLGLLALDCRTFNRHWPRERVSNRRDSHMNQDTATSEEGVRVPIMQRILDNPFLLLFIGVVFPAVFYIIWGIMEIVTIPLAP
jgi:hypothetical protein